MRHALVFLVLVGLGAVVGAVSSAPATAEGFCGGVRIDCDTGYVEPASAIVIPEAQVTGLSTSLAAKVNVSSIGAAGGVCALDSSSLVAVSNIPPITEAKLSLSDVTTRDVSTTAHGLAPKLPGDSTKYFNGNGGWSTPAGGGGGGLTTVYSVDFTAQTPQTISVNGSVTIDGKTWTVYNVSASQTFAINTTNGLYIRCSTGSSNNADSQITGPGIYAPLTNFSASLEPSQYSEVWVWYLFTQPHTPNAQYEVGMLGVVSIGSSMSATSINRFSLNRGYDGSLYQMSFQTTYSGASSSYREVGSRTGMPFYDVFVLRISSNKVSALRGISSGGAFPSRSSLTQVSWAGIVGAANPGQPQSGSPETWAVWASPMSTNSSGASDLGLKKLQIQVL